MRLVWGVVELCCLIGFFWALLSPQVTGVVMGIAWAVIPYCLARAMQMHSPQKVKVISDDK